MLARVFWKGACDDAYVRFHGHETLVSTAQLCGGNVKLPKLVCRQRFA